MGKKTIIDAIRDRLKKKPVTREEIEQLELEARKYRLQAEIAKSKEIIRKSKENQSSIMNSLFGLSGPHSNQDQDASRGSKEKRRRSTGQYWENSDENYF